MEQTRESRGARLMRQLGALQGEDIGSGSPSGGNIGSDAGLSQMGAIPNAPLGLVTGQRTCPTCDAEVGPSVKYCPECGATIVKQTQEKVHESKDAYTERFERYRQRSQRQENTPITYGSVFEDISFRVTELVKRGSPDLIPRGDVVIEEELCERVVEMLESFAKWKTRYSQNRS